MDHYGALSLIPTACVLALAVWSRRALEPLIAGSIIGVLMLGPADALGSLATRSQKVLANTDVIWVILVCGLMGSLIGLLLRSGSSAAFAAKMSRLVKGPRTALITTWVMGILLFVDDYLNSLAVGTAMRKVSDTYNISREMLAYVVDSTAAPISVIIPISTWAVFFGKLLETNNVAPAGQGVATYIGAIPYMLYPWIAVFMIPLVAAGIIPLIGPMKKAEKRAQNEGKCVPPGSEKIDEQISKIESGGAAVGADRKNEGIVFFIASMASLAFFTWYFNLDFLKGIYITLAWVVIYLIGKKALSAADTFDTCMEGFKSMLDPLAVLSAAFLLNNINISLGLTTYVVHATAPLLTAAILPAAIMLVMGLVAFGTGSNWGVFVIILPIVTTLANKVGADMDLVIGATLSASVFSSHACFYSDATVLTAQATGCTPFQHAWTQIPYALLAWSISVVGFLMLGYTFH